MSAVFERTWVDTETGRVLGEDMYGYTHILSPQVQPTIALPCGFTRILLNGLHIKFWPDNGDFYPFENHFGGDNPLDYTIPHDYTLYLTSVLAAQSDPGLTLLGMYVNDVYAAHTPFYTELAHGIPTELSIPAGSKLEIKVWPHDKKTRVSVLIGGYLMNEK